MAIPTTDLDIGTRYALQEDFNNGFVGRDRQVVIQTDDPKGYRPVIMDGVTQGGKSKVALLTDLSDYVAVSTYNSDKAGFETTTHASATYATKTEVNSGLSAKAPIANPAFTGTATVGGKTIATTDQIPTDYLTESDLTEIESNITDLQGQISDKTPDYGTLGALPDNNVTQLSNLKVTNSTLANYAGVNAQLVYNTDTKQWVSMDGETEGGANTLVNANGNRGKTGGYSVAEQISGSITIDPSSVDNIDYICGRDQTSINITINDVAGVVTLAFAVKVITISTASKITAINFTGGISAKYFLNGSAPELDGSNEYLLVILIASNCAYINFTKVTTG